MTFRSRINFTIGCLVGIASTVAFFACGHPVWGSLWGFYALISQCCEYDHRSAK